MEMPLTGKVYDIQGFSVQDGPGIRTTVFLKGCPLRCPWCHSPESQQFHAQLSWMAMRCLGVASCGKCLPVCPKGAITLGKIVQHVTTREEIQLVRIDRTMCDACGSCAAACHPKALSICGTDYTVEELVERVGLDLPFYEQSGGGVTLSGGEALAQFDFSLHFLKGVKQRGMHTALDTTGYADWERIAAVMPYTDLFLYDLKHLDNAQHRKATGVPNALILENARKIAQAGGKLQIRIPVIPQFNDSKKNIAETGMFCKSLGGAVTLVQLLPYHTLGVMKWERISEAQVTLEAVPPSEERLIVLKKVLEGLGLPVTLH